jgi:hypothetical protein
MSNTDRSKKKHVRFNAKPRAEGKSGDQTPNRSTITEVSSAPQLTVLQLRPRNNYAEWEKNNESYFAHTYGKHGEFFETMEKYRPPVPKRPTVRPAAREATASSSSGSAAAKASAAPVKQSSGSAKAIPKTRTTNLTTTAIAPTKYRDKAGEDSSGSDSENSSDDDDDSTYDDAMEDADVVDSVEAATYIYNKRLDNKVKDELYYERTKPQMYADLLRSLGPEAEATVRTSSKFENAHREKDEVLLRKICHKKLRQYSTARGVSKEIRSAKNLYQIHQFSGEHTSEYYERFKREVDAYETYMGETLAEHHKAGLFTEGLHNARYGTMKIDIENGVIKRKRTLDKAYKQAMKRVFATNTDGQRTTGILASNYTAQLVKENKSQKPKHDEKRDAGYQKQQGKRQQDSTSFKKKTFPCTTCKLLGEENTTHRAHECPNESKALSIIKEAIMFTDADVNPAQAKKGSYNLMMFADTEAAYTGLTGQLRSDEIVFDPGSTINIFSNPRLLDGETRKATLEGISTFGGEASAHQIGEYKGMDTYVNPDGPVNLLSQRRLRMAGAKISYHDGDDEYTVEFPNGDAMSFPARDDVGGLYVYTPMTIFVNATVKERLKIYTKREQRKAIEARGRVPNLGFPSDKDYASMLSGNLVRNMPGTAADVYRAQRIFGKDVPSYMGKTVRKTAPKIDLEKVEAMIEKRITLGMDVFQVNAGAYMLSVSSFKYKMVTYMGILNKTMHNDADTFWFHIKHHVNSYLARGFAVKEIKADNENAFIANKANVEGLGVKLEVTYGSKVEECERAIRTIKERHRAYAYYIPFPLTHMMEKYLVLNCARLLNAYPTHGNGYDGIPPTEIYRGSKLDWKVDFPVAYGDVCLVPSDVGDTESKTAKARGEIAIAMLPHGNNSGDVTFLNTRTMCKIVRNQYTVIPTPQYIINHLKSHVGNKFAESRRNPIYRNFRGDLISEGEEVPAEEPPQQLADAAEPMIPVNRDTSEHVDDEIHQEHAPGNALEPEEPAVDQAPQQDDPSNAAESPQDEELHVDGVGVPFVDLDDLQRRYPLRSNRTTWREQSYYAATSKMSVNKPPNAEPRQRLQAMAKELFGIAVTKKGISPVSATELTYREIKGVISSKLFTKAKYSPDGEFEKWKARLVAGGHMQNREEYTYLETSSPTVGITSILTIAAIAAKERRKTATVDFTAAYLNAEMTEGKKILMRLSREASSILCMLVPEYKTYLRDDGTVIVRLTKALYGCIESAKLWYDSICNTLIADGFTRNDKDPCIFNRVFDGKQITVCVYVDDLLISCEKEKGIESVIEMLRRKYSDMTHNVSKKLKYVGMILDFSKDGECCISMPNFVDTLISDVGVTTNAPTPAGIDLFATRGSDPVLDEEKADLFHSIIMKLQYLAKRVRPDILLPVVFLSSRVTKCTVEDWKKLERIVRYLRGTRELCLRIKPADGIMTIFAFVDASFAVHHDFRSHTGAVITFGLGSIFFRSVKQKLNTKSSTEAELVGVSDAMNTVIWLRDFLIGQGYDVGPAILFQDNMSTIALMQNGRGNNERSRHINIKFFFITDRVDKGEIAIKYMPTEEMLADLLTKPLQGKKFRLMRDKLLGLAAPT